MTTGLAGEGPVGVDLAALQGWFDAHGIVRAGPLRAELLEGGRSNLTYLLHDGATRWVLRRPPLGLVAPTANDLGREHRVVEALGRSAVPVPPAVAHCDDPGVIGAPFAIAGFVDGRVVRSTEDGRDLGADGAARCTAALVDGLVALHAVDPASVGLEGLGRADGYVARQVARWHQQWQLVATGELPALDELHRRLAAAVPPQGGTAIVHGDYRIDNVILAPDDPGTIAAVVDWEMATLGDPLADLGLLLVYWDPIAAPVLPDGHPVAGNPGFPGAAAVAEAYGEASGRSLARLPFYRALGCFKLAVIAEGIHGRFLQGLTVGEGFETVGTAVAPLVEAGLRELPR